MVAINEINVTPAETMTGVMDEKIADDLVRDNARAAGAMRFIGQVMVMLRKLIRAGGFASGKAPIGQVEQTPIGEVEVVVASTQAMAQPDFLLGAGANPVAAEVAARPVLCKAVRIWSAHRASGRDVSQSPSNLG